MTELHDSKQEKYAGPSKPALALLESRVYGFFGGIVGAIGGAVLSGHIVDRNGQFVQDTFAKLDKLGVKVSARVGLMITGAVLGSAVLHRVGAWVGLAVGAKKSGDPEAQFNRTQSRIANLEEKVDTLLARTAEASFSEREAARASASESTLSR